MANEKRLIDANALCDRITATFPAMSANEMYVAIEKAPTVDAVPVVFGYWTFGTAVHREFMKCSVCLKSQTPTGVFTYCPNCGAKMDGGNEDDL